MIKTTKGLLDFWEEQMKQSHRSSNYFFRKSPSHYHMMLIVMAAYKSAELERAVDPYDDDLIQFSPLVAQGKWKG